MNNQADVTQTLADYYRTFSTLDLQAILPYFQVPALTMGSIGVFPVPDASALAAIFTKTIQDLRNKSYGRSEYLLRQLKLLSATAALAIGVAVRYKTDGEELERVGITYVMHKEETGWKIVVMIFSDTDVS